MYAVDWREYPASVKRKIDYADPNAAGDPLLLQGEHAGFMGGTYTNPPAAPIPGIRDLPSAEVAPSLSPITTRASEIC